VLGGQQPDSARDDAVLTVAQAARVARRSVRTIRRAYRAGHLVAHRDGNGRNISIRYGDLRAWLLAAELTPAPAAPTVPQIQAASTQRPRPKPHKTGNLELLIAAREQHRRARNRRRAARRSS
jgi:excisionase family DNA binding protein